MSAVLEAKDAIRELMARYAQALDACRFAEPHCIRTLTIDDVWPRIEAWLSRSA